MPPTYDISIVLTITADSKEEAAEMLIDLYNLDEDNPPDWGAVIIKELKPLD